MLAKLTLSNFKEILQDKIQKLVMFTVTVGFEGENTMTFTPNEAAIMAVLRKNTDEIVHIINNIPRLLYAVCLLVYYTLCGNSYLTQLL